MDARNLPDVLDRGNHRAGDNPYELVPGEVSLSSPQRQPTMPALRRRRHLSLSILFYRLLLIVLAIEVAISSSAFAVTYTITDLGTLGGTDSVALGLNEAGQVVGYSYLPDNTTFRAFLYSNGTMHDLGTLGGAHSIATGINEAGQVVGYAYLPDNAVEHAFLYSNGTMHDLGTLGGIDSFATGINEAGQVVGYSDPLGNVGQHAFLYSNGTMHDLGTLGGAYSLAYGINEAGQVVGRADLPNTAFHAFLYSNGTMHDLNSLLPVGSGWVLFEARAINNAGAIVGTGSHNGTRAFLMQPLQEPQEPTIVSFTATPTMGTAPIIGVPVAFTVTVADPSLVDSVEWDFDGNGTGDQTTTTLTTEFSYPTDGSFTVMVTVSNADGGEASALLTVTVQSPTQAITTANTLVQELPLNRGQQNNLTRKLDDAQDLLSQGDITGACDQLNDVVSQLDALVKNRRLSTEDAAPVLGEVHAIQQSLGCS